MYYINRFISTLSHQNITKILRKDEIIISKSLPSYAKSIECNQLASNQPIEDRVRISSVQIPGFQEPTLFLGVFDGHGGGTTADLISRRLFNYIALSLHPEMLDLHDFHHSPTPKHDPTLRPAEIESLQAFKNELQNSQDVKENLKASFKRCDDDLSKEIQTELTSTQPSYAALHYYLSAAVSGCCAIVMVIHQGICYLASVGDCRAVYGTINQTNKFTATELIDEHNCDNVNEIRRLAATHPASEQNTIVKHNRLLGHLMPFRAFGDFNYKWTPDMIHACGLTKAYGNSVIPAHYETPPYLIVEPEIIEMPVNVSEASQRFVVIATDGLWELFESSRDVVESIAQHSNKSLEKQIDDDFDENCATHVLRNALGSGSPNPNCTMDLDAIKRMQHTRLEAMLTLPKSISRNFRDDISIIVLKFT